MENSMKYLVSGTEQSLTSRQRCYFPPNIPDNAYGTYATVTLNNQNKYFVKIMVDPIQSESECIIDKTVQCFPQMFQSVDYETVNYQDVTIIKKVKYIKKACVGLVFKSAWKKKEWNGMTDSLISIIKRMLQLFVHINNSLIHVENFEFNSIGLHSIIIYNIGNIPAGKVVESTKIILEKITCYEKYSLLKDISFRGINLAGLNTPYETLKEHFINMQKCFSHHDCLDPINLTSSSNILLIGPDSCGKKTLVNYLAYDCEAAILRIDVTQLAQPQRKKTNDLLTKTLEHARLLCNEGPCIILIPKIESICRKGERKMKQLFDSLKSIYPAIPLAVIATISSPNLLPKSINLSFENKVFLSVPNEDERCEMISNLCDGVLSKEETSEISSSTPGFVIGDLVMLFETAKRKMYSSKHVKSIRENNLFLVLKEMLSLVQPSSVRGELGLVKNLQKVDIEEIGGLSQIKESLIEYIQWPLLDLEIRERFNVRKPCGALLYGPPGCAKTTFVRALASSSNITFLSVSAAELLSPYFGDTEKSISNLFQRARDASPTIFFIDEIDALIGNRSDKEGSTPQRILNTFLVEMDGIGLKQQSNVEESASQCQVTVIGATNRPDCLDSAFVRPGRIDRLIYFPPPTFEDRFDILKVITKKMPISSCVRFEYIAENTEYYSGADLNVLCQMAAVQAFQLDGMDAKIIKHEHWLKALKEVPPSLTKQQIQWYNDFSFS